MKHALLAGFLLLAIPATSRAEVVDVADNGFAVTFTADVNAPIMTVFRAISEQISRWWDPVHTYSQNAANLQINPQPGGCFCERLPTGGVQHMIVTRVSSPTTFVMAGGLGPLGTLGVTGVMEWSLAESGGRTQLRMTYNVGGYAKGGFAQIAPAVDGVLTAQVTRLKSFAETGRPQ